MLVGSGRIGIPKFHCLALHRCPHAIRNNSVLREITAADYIARACGGNAHCTGLREKGLLVRVSHQLRAALRVRVGIVAIQLLILGKAVICLFRVLINLIGRHVEETLHTAEFPHGLEEVHGAHHIGLIGLTRQAIGLSDQGLRREVQHAIRLCLPNRFFEALKVANIRNRGVHLLVQRKQSKERWLALRRKCIAVDFRAEQAEHDREPASLKSRVAGQKYALSRVKLLHILCVFHLHHRFQGALSSSQSVSSFSFSRCVSMHCQKPSCA